VPIAVLSLPPTVLRASQIFEGGGFAFDPERDCARPRSFVRDAQTAEVASALERTRWDGCSATRFDGDGADTGVRSRWLAAPRLIARNGSALLSGRSCEVEEVVADDVVQWERLRLDHSS
jgi:hypothetical protein